MSATNTLTYEVDVANDHKLQIDLPVDISGKVKVMVIPKQETEKNEQTKNDHSLIKFLESLPPTENPRTTDEIVRHVRQLRDEWD